LACAITRNEQATSKSWDDILDYGIDGDREGRGDDEYYDSIDAGRG